MFSEKGGRECGREGRRGKKKEIQLQRRYNYKFPTRTMELFVRGTRPVGGTGEKGKKRKKTAVEKLTTPFPRIAIAIVLTERTNNSTNCGPRPSSRVRVALFTILTTFSSPALRFSTLSIAVFAIRTKASEKYVNSNRTRCGMRGKALPNSETRER